MPAKNKPNEIYISRIYDAPVKMVWEAWVDPKQVAKWWGPRGFTLTTRHKDVRPGGSWDYTMHGPDGTDYPNYTIFHEVEKYSRLVYDHGGTKTTPPLFRVTVEFKEEKGKTKMEMIMALATKEAADETKKFIKKAGGNATWDRLAEYLSQEKDIFVIARSFEAPIETVFSMFTDPKHFSKWLPPTGMEMKSLDAKIQPGGTNFYCMSNGAITMYGKIHYKEINPPNQLIYTQVFCDENGNVSRHPMAPTWPETMLTTITLTEEGKNQTRVNVQWEVYGEASSAEREMFHQQKGGMTQGWSGSFDKLEEYLKKS